MATAPIGDYSNRDYASLVESLLDVAAVRLPEWTDRSENDIGRLLLELFAYVGDTILYYQDRVAAEAFLATAVERRSVIDLLALIGYELSTPAPAAVALELTPQDATVMVRIDVGARFATVAAEGRPAVEFAYLPVGDQPLEQMPVAGSTGRPHPIRFTALNATPVSSDLGQSVGLENQGFRLPQSPVILARDPVVWDGLVVEVQTAGVWERWERRSTLLDSGADDACFVVRVDDDDTATVYFGDGRYGRIPPAAAPVRARYLIGGGAAGNVGPGTVTVIASGVNVQATVRNPLGASGGEDREAIEHARAHAPGVFRSQQRAVTVADYVELAESYPGVARAMAVAPMPDHTVVPARTARGQSAPSLVSWNYVDLIVVAEGALDLTDALRGELQQYFDARKMVTTIVSIRSPVFVRVDIRVVVGVEPTAYAADVRARALERVRALFDLDQVDFGQPVYLSKVYEAVEAVEGVAYADVRGFRGRRSYPPGQMIATSGAGGGRIPLREREFPRPGRIRITTEGGLS
jgi:hypothetical protein